jgi:hypothetical protein
VLAVLSSLRCPFKCRPSVEGLADIHRPEEVLMTIEIRVPDPSVEEGLS